MGIDGREIKRRKAVKNNIFDKKTKDEALSPFWRIYKQIFRYFILPTGLLLIAAIVMLSVFPQLFSTTSEKPSQVVFDNTPLPKNPKIEVNAEPVSNHQIKFLITTNIPLPIDVLVAVDLIGQNSDETYIGHSKTITLSESPRSFVLDTPSKPPTSGKLIARLRPLPSGSYIAKATFYPNWGAKNGSPTAKEITSKIEGQMEIFLHGSGQSTSDRREMDTLQRWVMDHVYTGSNWNEDFYIQKLGAYKKVPLRIGGRNPNILKAYYFPNANITFQVNIYKERIDTWYISEENN